LWWALLDDILGTSLKPSRRRALHRPLPCRANTLKEASAPLPPARGHPQRRASILLVTVPQGRFVEIGWINAELMGLCCSKDLCGALRLAPRRCAPVTPGLTVSSARGARSTRQYFRPPHPASRPANLKRGSEDSAHSLSFLCRVHLVVIWMMHTYLCEYACWCGAWCGVWCGMRVCE